MSNPPRRRNAIVPIRRAYAARVGEAWVEARGVVLKLLPDDNEGSRHQRFLVQFKGGLMRRPFSVLVAHNIDLAERVPLKPGDRVTIRGEYGWNELGGRLHWTHHDPGGWHDGGWIEHRGRRYV